MTCGQSTISSTREIAYKRCQQWNMVCDETEEKEIVEVKDAAEVFRPIFDQYADCNFILKMDCEGEEYGIIERLAQEQILGCFSLIMMEWHYRGSEPIIKHLQSAGFSYWCEDKAQDMGLIYAWR